VKNTLATIQAIASQSLRKSATPQDFVLSFNGRVQALARAHDLLVQRKMRGAMLRDLLREQVALGPVDVGRISLSGPDVMLGARIAVQLALVLHELATNARKHGALSVADGRLSIAWSIEMLQRGRELLLTWQETGVGIVEAPAATGFGMTLIARSVGANGGQAAIRYGVDGLICEIRLPLEKESAGPDEREERSSALPQPSAAQAEPADVLRGRRVLLVEDEPLVALDMEAELQALGLEVIGPASSVAAAERLIAERACDAALLDANLHGQSVERLAAALRAKGVPFAFATGYGREALPEAFRDVAVLAKPFDAARVAATLRALLAGGGAGGDTGRPARGRIVSLRPRAS
jgi:two-component sensor histidine kinase/CheY-like chemotaxis protein